MQGQVVQQICRVNYQPCSIWYLRPPRFRYRLSHPSTAQPYGRTMIPLSSGSPVSTKWACCIVFKREQKVRNAEKRQSVHRRRANGTRLSIDRFFPCFPSFDQPAYDTSSRPDSCISSRIRAARKCNDATHLPRRCRRSRAFRPEQEISAQES